MIIRSLNLLLALLLGILLATLGFFFNDSLFFLLLGARLLDFGFFELEGLGAFTAGKSVPMSGHEDTDTAVGAGFSGSGDSTATVDGVEFKDSELHIDVLVVTLLLGGESLLLLLLTTAQVHGEENSGVFFETEGSQSLFVFEVVTSIDESLEVSIDAFFSFDSFLELVDGLSGFDLEGKGSFGKGFNEKVHCHFF